MFNVLGDVYAISDDSLQFQMFEEFPVRMIYDFANMTGCAYSRSIPQSGRRSRYSQPLLVKNFPCQTLKISKVSLGVMGS
jgi:hypothetical protein